MSISKIVHEYDHRIECERTLISDKSSHNLIKVVRERITEAPENRFFPRILRLHGKEFLFLNKAQEDDFNVYEYPAVRLRQIKDEIVTLHEIYLREAHGGALTYGFDQDHLAKMIHQVISTYKNLPTCRDGHAYSPEQPQRRADTECTALQIEAVGRRFGIKF
ncbi:hypothetical protein HDU89_008942 [Geranomyces variabilis]|nr:hypothetical protein HDU89_008942 [Geranomyces variabilis]